MMGIGTLAISGIPPLQGFGLKMKFLPQFFKRRNLLWILGSFLLAAFMTAFYMGRHWLLIFVKEPDKSNEEIKEAPKNMTRPLILLGIFQYL